MYDNDLLQGALVLLRDYLAPQAGERLLLAYDPLVAPTAEALAAVARDSGMPTDITPLGEDFGVLRLRFAQHAVIAFLEATTSHFRDELLTALSEASFGQRTRVYRVFDTTPTLLRTCFRVSRQDLLRLNNAVIDAARRCTTVAVRNDAGTNLTIILSPQFGWINSHGHFDGRHPGVLPPGEVATFSDQIDGTLVADGAINANFPFPFDPRLRHAPVRLELRQSRVVSIQTDHPTLAQVIKPLLNVENADRVGEVGFGTNTGIQGFVPFLSHINERYPALHLGLGSHNQRKATVDWDCPLHLDLILGNCTIAFDGVTVCEGGCWFPNGLPPAAESLPFDDAGTAFADTF